jgi:hypothetical protein
MKEAFLHHLWKFKLFDLTHLVTVAGDSVRIVHSGNYLALAGPDFFNAQVIIGNQKWAGNVEIHLKSSDWYLHHHERDAAYDSVILHVVWEHDAAIFRKDNSEIPVLELKNYVSSETLARYEALMLPKSWIFCENQLTSLDSFVLKNWQERLFFERLERKSKAIEELLVQTNQDWEAVLFCMLAKNFGLNINGDSFLQIALSIPFSVIRKESYAIEHIESLLFGQSGLLLEDKEDLYFKQLQSNFEYQQHKYQIEKAQVNPLQFFKHRPDNFPTLRLSQLANLYHKQPYLFSSLMALTSIKDIYDLFSISVSNYWETHYQFDKVSPKKKKMLSKSFIDLLIINTLIPLRFLYAKSQGKEVSEELISLLNQVAPEKNAIMDKFKSFSVVVSDAFESQALLELKNEYCNKFKCMECAIGISVLKSNENSVTLSTQP